MKWKEFLNTLAGSRAIDIVGPFAANWKPTNRPALYVDRGLSWRKPGPVSASVGDGDSAGSELDMLLPQEKDFSDFAFALRSLPQSIVDVQAFGFLGGRRDHELGNFGEAHAFLLGRLKPSRISWDNEVVSWSAGSWEFEHEGIFSLMVLERARVSIEGSCRYLLHSAELSPLSSHGLSNAGHGLIRIRCDRPIFCFKMGENHATATEAVAPRRKSPPNKHSRG